MTFVGFHINQSGLGRGWIAMPQSNVTADCAVHVLA